MKKFNFLHLFSPRQSSCKHGSALGLSKTLCKLLLVAIITLSFAACGDKDKGSGTPATPEPPVIPDLPPLDPSGKITLDNLAGEWKLTQWTVDSEFSNNIYLEILADNTFVLYEDITSHGFSKMTGTFAFDNDANTISGTYTNGRAWGSSYTIAMPDVMTMRWTAIGKDDTSVYTRTVIPSDIVQTSRAAQDDEGFPFL